ncbi:MAG: hypothetical protein V1826_02325 [bacterium]
MPKTTSDYDWPGWPLNDNPYGSDFDLPARKRMIAGSRQLWPLIQKYKNRLGTNLLEVGPFFNPLITPKEFPKGRIFYWENDRHVLKWLPRQYPGTAPIYCDLNKVEGISALRLKMETLKRFLKFKTKSIRFDAVVASHVLNYIDYRLFLLTLKGFIKPGGLLFINNVVNYGLPPFFSDKRPHSIVETLQTIRDAGYSILESRTIKSVHPRQKNKRLLVVAQAT